MWSPFAHLARFRCASCVLAAVFPDGSLCLDIIQDKWSPVYSVSTILTSIQVRSELLESAQTHGRTNEANEPPRLRSRPQFARSRFCLRVAESSVRSQHRLPGQSRCSEAVGVGQKSVSKEGARMRGTIHRVNNATQEPSQPPIRNTLFDSSAVCTHVPVTLPLDVASTCTTARARGSIFAIAV